MSALKTRLLTAVLTAVTLLISISAAIAHIDVTLKDPSGATVGANTPYSTKMTCGGCHFNCSTGAYDDNRSTWCQTQVAQKDCSTPGNCPDYASYATSDTLHTQGFPNASGTISFATSTITSPQHGASVGYHSQQGRNEELTNAQRTIWGAPAFVGGSGMFGRYCMPSNRQLVRKEFDPAGGGREMEMGVSNWAKSCGVCHAGGGQMEYDRNMNEYGASSPTGDRYTWLIPTPANPTGRLVDISTLSGNDLDRQLMGSNKAEVDCLLCHMKDIRSAAAYYKNTLGCSNANQTGPADNPNCGTQKAVFMDMKTGTPMMMPDDRFTFAIGDFYDSFNRNIAVSYGYLKQAAAAGLGAGVNLADGSITGMPTSLAGSKILGTPASGNCAQCHARNERDNIGLPGEAQAFGGMIAGYGNFIRLTGAGDAFDFDKVDTSGACTSGCTNDKTWFEFGCKTGMGKRSQKTGFGSSDRWGNGFCMVCDSQDQWATNSFCGLPSVQAACIAATGKPDLISDGSPMSLIDMTANGPTPTTVPGKMPDVDVHDASSKGITCSSCHYTLSGTIPSRTISGSGAIYTYPSTSFVKMDHNMAKGYSMLEKAGDGFEGTVSCASCHIAGENNHPNAAALNAPIAGHAGFPALHFSKIDCRTCHIPAIYATPGRLMFRDWTAGGYRQTEGSNGNANHFEFAMSLLDGGMTPIQTIRMWIASPEGIKITPMQTNFLPIWAGSVQKASDLSVSWSPAKTRDITAAAAVVAKNNPGFGIRINGTSDFPGFEGFNLTDPLKIGTKAKIDAMAAELASARTGVAASHSAVRDARINLYPLFYDTSHGVVKKEWALGSPSRGGCIMCHSSSAKNPMTGQPIDPSTYSDKSVGFFDGNKEMLQNGFMQMASYDCDNSYLFSMMTGTTNVTCIETTPPEQGGTGLCDGTAKGSTSLGAQNGTMGLCKETIGGKLAQSMGMAADPMMRMDGVEFMQMMAIREGASAHNCNPMMQIFGLPTHCNPEDYYSRGEITLYFAKALEQSFFAPSVAGAAWTDPVSGPGTVPATLGRVFGVSAQLKKNPGNAAHQATFDFGATCRNPMTGSTFPCSDAMPGMTNLINTAVGANQLLGYSDTAVADLMSPSTSGYQRPLAAFFWSASTTTSYQVNFNASGALCANGPCTYSWSFTGATSDAGTGAVLSRVFSGSTGTATLTVTDVNGFESTMSKTVTASSVNAAPVALGLQGGLYSSTSGTPAIVTNATNVVSFTDASTDADNNLTSVTVNWGDGNVDTGAPGGTFTHRYARAAKYTILHTVRDGGWLSNVEKAYVKIVPPRYVISGTIRTAGGMPVNGAFVSLKLNGRTKSGMISTAGTYAFAPQPTGSYTLKIYKRGYTFSDPGTINLTGDTVAPITATPVP